MKNKTCSKPPTSNIRRDCALSDLRGAISSMLYAMSSCYTLLVHSLVIVYIYIFMRDAIGYSLITNDKN